jgi:hypothetical protein
MKMRRRRALVMPSPDPREFPAIKRDDVDVDVAIVFVGGAFEVRAPGYEALCPTSPASDDPSCGED